VNGLTQALNEEAAELSRIADFNVNIVSLK